MKITNAKIVITDFKYFNLFEKIPKNLKRFKKWLGMSKNFLRLPKISKYFEEF